MKTAFRFHRDGSSAKGVAHSVLLMSAVSFWTLSCKLRRFGNLSRLCRVSSIMLLGLNPMFRTTLVPALCLCLASGCTDSRSPGRSATDSPLVGKADTGVPSGAPAAAFTPEARMPEPAGWPFEQGAPRISGTGRYAWGAYYWTDFVYDANGGLGIDPPADHYGSPTGGGFRYPADPAMAGNGADIFRVAIGQSAGASWWRVDWQTLADAGTPVAAFGLDFADGGLDNNASWPAVPRLRAAGVDAVLILAAQGYRLLNAAGELIAQGEVSVDLASQSFVAELPQNLLSTDGVWTVFLAAGLNDGSGGFRDEMASFAGLPSEPPVFNVAFRDYADESVEKNFWMDMGQAQALSAGDISPFSARIDWARMQPEAAEPTPHLTGYINRWYVSSVDPQAVYGRRGIDRDMALANGHPVYLDKVQPYGLYVPAGLDPLVPAPLTLMLHSGSQMHNQYGATTPNFIARVCEERGALCLTTLGRGPSGDFEGDAELDLWEAWKDVARHYRLDPERTHSSGYSMGGNSTLRLLMKYPDVLAGGIVLAGGDDRVIDLALLPNLRWHGYYHAQGSFDQMVPFPEARAIADELKALGYQYVLDHFLLEDHVAWALKDMLYPAFDDAARWLIEDAPPARKRNPGLINFNWAPGDVRPDLGVGPLGPWWLGDLQAADERRIASISAHSGARPEAAILDLEFTTTPLTEPTPHLQERQRWVLGPAPEPADELRLSLNNVLALSIDLHGAGLGDAEFLRLHISSDSPGRLLLRNSGRFAGQEVFFTASEGQTFELGR